MLRVNSKFPRLDAKFISDLCKQIEKAKPVSHRFLDDNGLEQFFEFSNGIKIYFNFEEYMLKVSKGKDCETLLVLECGKERNFSGDKKVIWFNDLFCVSRKCFSKENFGRKQKFQQTVLAEIREKCRKAMKIITGNFDDYQK